MAVIEPGGEPELRDVDVSRGAYEAISDLVGGYLERVWVLTHGTNAIVYVNEEGVPLGLPANRIILMTKKMVDAQYLSPLSNYRRVPREGEPYAYLYGTIVIVGEDENEEETDLSETDFRKVCDRLASIPSTPVVTR
jgi:hypothetical protein